MPSAPLGPHDQDQRLESVRVFLAARLSLGLFYHQIRAMGATGHVEILQQRIDSLSVLYSLYGHIKISKLGFHHGAECDC